MPESISLTKEILNKYKIKPKKRLGQNFLIDPSSAQRIIDSADIKNTDIVIEIGPGLGAITKDLCKKAEYVNAVEIDKSLCQVLSEVLEKEANLSIINSDILKLDLEKLSSGKKIKIIGNLPYYISTPIIIKMIDNRKSIAEAYITVQKEVAQRLTASPGVKDYGSITCYLNFYADTTKLFDIPRKSFYPQPNVDSSFVKIKFLDKPRVQVKDEGLFFSLIRASFNQRRKTLLNSLSQVISRERVGEILKKANIDSSRRGETLSLEEFARIANIA